MHDESKIDVRYQTTLEGRTDSLLSDFDLGFRVDTDNCFSRSSHRKIEKAQNSRAIGCSVISVMDIVWLRLLVYPILICSEIG